MWTMLEKKSTSMSSFSIRCVRSTNPGQDEKCLVSEARMLINSFLTTCW